MKRWLPFLAVLLVCCTGCGDDKTNPGDNDGWIHTTDPVTGVALACYYVDGYNSGAMHCERVGP